MVKWFFALCICSLSNSAFAVGWVVNLGLHEGGEEVAYINYADGSQSKMMAGGLFQVTTGVVAGFKRRWSTELSAGLKLNRLLAAGQSIKFQRTIAELLLFRNINQDIRLGGGLSYHMNGKVSGDVGNLNLASDGYEDTLGFILQVGAKWKRFTFDVRYTNLSYTSVEQTDFTRDGSSVSANFGILLGGKP